MHSPIISGRSKNAASRVALCGWKTRAVILACSFGLALNGGAQSLDHLFFLHHSTGQGLINGGMRDTVQAYNSAHGTSFEFWDHGYSSDGLRNASGEDTGISYGSPTDNTNPDGLHYIFTSSESDAASCRNLILDNHEVIAFKSCFPASEITDEDMLNQYKTYYLEMRSAFDLRTDRLFVVMSTPPQHRLATTETPAAYARQFANWLKSAEYLGGHTNIVCFDLFNYLAGTDNFLKYEYEGSHTETDSHPNDTANQTVGPIFANFLMTSALAYTPAGGSTNSPTPPTTVAVPTIRANGATDQVAVNYPDPVSVTVELNAGSYAGTDSDWWVVACAVNSGEWYYLNSGIEWILFSGDLAECQAAYQGALFNLQSTTALCEYSLPPGTYIFYFAIDQLDGILNYPDGPILYNAVTVNVD